MADANVPAEIVELVEQVQEEIRDAAVLMRSVFAVADGEDVWPAGSTADVAFQAGVEAGMAAAMGVFHRRGWLSIPPATRPASSPCSHGRRFCEECHGGDAL